MVTASLTTIEGREKSLKETVNSLIDQVDRLNIYVHGTECEFKSNKKIKVVFSDEDHGDLDKFHWIDKVKGWHFVCDDDLIYPKTYVKDSIEFIEKNGKDHVYSYHGVIPFSLPIISYYQDRYVYPCLGEVNALESVRIASTGALVYYSEEPLKFEYKHLERNMADIHFNIFLSELGKERFVIPHKEGYIKHSKNVDLEKTIYEQNKDTDFIQTDYINRNPKAFGTERILPVLPLVTVAVVNSRQITHRDKVKRCFDSIRNQLYPHIEIVKVDNLDRLVSIGKCFNDAVKSANGELVLFVGDDDWISSDYVCSLVDTLLRHPDPKAVGCTSYITVFNDQGDYKANELVPTGMWFKEWLLAHPFKEYLTKYVDTELFEETKQLGYHIKTAGNQYGYYYNSHDGQVSGNKKLLQNYEATEQNQNEISKLLDNIKRY